MDIGTEGDASPLEMCGKRVPPISPFFTADLCCLNEYKTSVNFSSSRPSDWKAGGDSFFNNEPGKLDNLMVIYL